MRCEVCRKDYFATHDCPGELYFGTPTRPSGTLPLGYYLGEMGKILRLDKLAIRRIEHDPRSLLFSIPLWYLTAMVGFLAAGVAGIFLLGLAPETESEPIALFGLLLAAPVIPFFFALGGLLQLAVCHGLGRLVFGGAGTFQRLLRPLLLGSAPLLLLYSLPVLNLIAGIWWLAVWAWVFEEVEGVSRIQAIGISIASGLLVRLLASIPLGLL